MNGYINVTAYIPAPRPDDPDYWGRPMPLMGPRPPKGGVVRIGFGDGTKVTGHRIVSVRPAFDPLATSMSPIKGWMAPLKGNGNIVWTAADGWHDGPRAALSLDSAGRIVITAA